jgi:hypothetical protein
VRRLVLLALSSLSLSARAQTPAVDAPPAATSTAEEDALFGGAAPSSAESPVATSDASEAALFGDSPVQVTPGAPPSDPAGAEGVPAELAPVDTAALYDRADAANDRTVIGGRFFNQNQASFRDGEPFGRAGLSAPTLLDVYLDGRPNDRVRVYARGRVSYDPTLVDGASTVPGAAAQPLTTQLDQLWLKWDAYRRVFFTLGRQRVKWGSGRFWNPTDFLNAQRLNSVAILDTRLGATLFKVHVPVESLGWNFYALANLTGASRPDDAGAAVRGEFLFGPAELALSAQVSGGPFAKVSPLAATLASSATAAVTSAQAAQNLELNAPVASTPRQLQLGIDLSSALGPVDFHVESALVHGSRQLWATGPVTQQGLAASALTPAGGAPLPLAYRDREWLWQVAAGGELSVKYTEQDSVGLGAEYFYNEPGEPDTSRYSTLLVGQNLSFFYLGRHYAAAYAFLANPGDWNNTSFTLSQLSNLSDKSNLTRLDYSFTALTNLTFRAFLNWHTGRLGEFKFGDALFTPLLASAPRAPSVVDAGVGFIVNL